MRRAILMCAGEYEPIPIPVGERHKSLRSAEAFDYGKDEDPLVVAVDGGLPRLLAQGIEPDLILGDFDSLEKKYHSYLEEYGRRHPGGLLVLPCEKDDTDTVYAARMCMERGCRELLFYGALGGRLDHTFANIQTLAWLKTQGADGYLVGKNTLAAVICAEKVLLPPGYEGTFSMFALDKEVSGVTLQGMKYPLSEAVVTNTFPIGVSNEVHADTVRGEEGGRASVTVRSGLALIILQSSEKKNEAPRPGIAEPGLPEKNASEQKKTEQNTLEQEKTEQNPSRQYSSGREKTEQNPSEQEKTEQNTPEQSIPEQSISEQNISDRNVPEQDIRKQGIPDPSELERIALSSFSS